VRTAISVRSLSSMRVNRLLLVVAVLLVAACVAASLEVWLNYVAASPYGD
jgi:hypothetical protein